MTDLKTEIVNFAEYLVQRKASKKERTRFRRHANGADLALAALELSIVYLSYKLEQEKQARYPFAAGVPVGKATAPARQGAF